MAIEVVVVSQPEAMQDHDERRKSYRELWEKVVEANGKCEMYPVEKVDTMHARPRWREQHDPWAKLSYAERSFARSLNIYDATVIPPDGICRVAVLASIHIRAFHLAISGSASKAAGKIAGGSQSQKENWLAIEVDVST